MKQLRFLLAALMLLVCGMVCHAQKVVVHKKDGTKVEYDASKVKKVKYAKAYYYYAGWELPTSKEELVKLAKEPNGGEVDMTKTYSATNILWDYSSSNNNLTNTTITNGTTSYKQPYYVVIPKTMKVYDSATGALFSDNDVCMTLISTIGEHNVWQTVDKSKFIDSIKIY